MRDAKLLFSDAQSMAINAAANSNSTNVIDLTSGNGKDALGNARVADPSAGGRPVVEILVTTALVGAADSAVLTIALYEHTAATSIDSGNLITSLTVTVGTAGVAAGTRFSLPIPADVIDERYIGLDYSVATQNISSGNVDAAIVMGREKQIP
jgi:hypothetical protein